MANDGWFDDESRAGLEGMLPQTPVVEAPRVLKCPSTGKDAVFLVNSVIYRPDSPYDGCLKAVVEYKCSISSSKNCSSCTLYTSSKEKTK